MRKIVTLTMLCFFQTAFSQGPTKFGKVDAADLQRTSYDIDKSAHAVYISDIGKTEITGNTKGWFSLEFKRYARIHILNKSAYDLATIEIPLYSISNDQTERLENLKAVTYNLENGKVVETKMSKDNVFTEKRSRKLMVKKFTLPNVKEGSIIEFEYRVTSDFLFNLQPWTFQGNYPRLWSEYNLALPQFLNYIFLGQGYQPFDVKEEKTGTQKYHIVESGGASASERYELTSNVTDYRWAMKNVPALKRESFTSSLDNHIAKINFQLSAYQHPLRFRNIMGSWTQLTQELLDDADFGKKLDDRNAWLGEVMAPLLKGATTDLEKAKNIYNYVRDNINCTNHQAIYASQPLKNVLKSKTGNVSDVNLLLTAMLLYAGIKADPVMLSTTDHGYTYSMYPVLDRFNYVISRAVINNKEYYLDASRPRLGFSKLMPDCYNGHARIINKEATPVMLEADSLKESKVTSVFISQDEKGNWLGSLNQKPGYYESYTVRNKVKEEGNDAFFKQVQKNFGYDIEPEETKIDALEDYDLPLTINYKFKLNIDKEDLIYLNPMFGEAYKENWFKSAERKYPVEMPYTFDETYLATIQVPEGYAIDELPKSIKVNLNEEGHGFFEYILSHSGGTISMRTRVKLTRAYFLPEEYELLREFFNLVVNKHKEQIVFKKKK